MLIKWYKEQAGNPDGVEQGWKKKYTFSVNVSLNPAQNSDSAETSRCIKYDLKYNSINTVSN